MSKVGLFTDPSIIKPYINPKKAMRMIHGRPGRNLARLNKITKKIAKGMYSFD